MAPSRLIRTASTLSLAALILGTSTFAFTWGREAVLRERRDHRHATMNVSTAVTMRDRLEAPEEQARTGGKLLATHLAAGLPPVALSRRIHLHGNAPTLTIEPNGKGTAIGRRSSLGARSAVLGRLQLAALAVLGVGFFGLLSTRRRLAPRHASARPSSEPSAAREGQSDKTSDLVASEGVPYPVLIHRDGIISWSNPAAARTLRRGSPFALLGSRPLDWLEGGQESRWFDHLRRLEAGDQVASSELVFRGEDGSTFEAEVNSVRISFDGHPSVESVLRFVPRAAPERRRTMESDSYARHVLDALDDGVLVVNPTGALCETNARAEELLGYSSVVLQRLDLAGLCPSASKEALAQLRAALRRALLGEHVEALELEVRRRDGETLPCTLSPRPTEISGRVVVVLRRA